VLAKQRRGLDVEVVERHDPVQALAPRQPAHPLDDILGAMGLG
jgi:hypothetical protein